MTVAAWAGKHPGLTTAASQTQLGTNCRSFPATNLASFHCPRNGAVTALNAIRAWRSPGMQSGSVGVSVPPGSQTSAPSLPEEARSQVQGPRSAGSPQGPGRRPQAREPHAVPGVAGVRAPRPTLTSPRTHPPRPL